MLSSITLRRHCIDVMKRGWLSAQRLHFILVIFIVHFDNFAISLKWRGMHYGEAIASFDITPGKVSCSEATCHAETYKVGMSRMASVIAS